jgi:NAD(P)-dependent dehydrogenase (short-subunit alcohol dehydrogenase family)
MFKQLFDLSGRVAVVTGGGRNIGLSTAMALAEFGAKVVIAEIDPQVGEEGLAALEAKGYEAELHQLDVTDSKAVTACADAVVKKYGRVDIAVANAGIALGSPGEIMPDEQWHKVIDINLNGVFYTNRAFGKHMLDAGKGAIVNIGSMSGIISNKPQEQVHYNAAKAGVHHLTKSLAGEWATRGVRVNAVAPTYIETAMTKTGAANPDWFKTWMEMTPMGRMGQPSEIAACVLFLASDAASLVTGHVLVADAGYTVW